MGNGRDVEMSVPSTKTYTCHLVLGFIFSEQILKIYNNVDNKLFAEQVMADQGITADQTGYPTVGEMGMTLDDLKKSYKSVNNYINNIENIVLVYK